MVLFDYAHLICGLPNPISFLSVLPLTVMLDSPFP
jgi:hypothetical protein